MHVQAQLLRALEGRELTRAYVKEVYELTEENMSETSRRTGLDRRTVKRYLNPPRRK